MKNKKNDFLRCCKIKNKHIVYVFVNIWVTLFQTACGGASSEPGMAVLQTSLNAGGASPGAVLNNTTNLGAASPGSGLTNTLVSTNGNKSASNIKKIDVSYVLSDALKYQSGTAKGRRIQTLQAYTLTTVVTPSGAAAMSPTSGRCSSAQCTVGVSLPIGLDTIKFSISDSGTGAILDEFTTSIVVETSTTPTLSFSGNPVVNSVSVQAGASTAAAGSAVDIPITINALDADGNIIAGTANYIDVNGNPLDFELSISNSQAGGTGTMSLEGPIRISSPGQTSTYVHYDGKWLSSAIISISSSRSLAGSTGNATITTTPTTVSEYAIPTASSGPWAIVKGNDGNLWFSEKNGNKIGRLTPTGVISEFPIPTASGTPNEMAMGPDGNLWATEQYGNKVAKISMNGTVTEVSVLGGLLGLAGLTMGPDGNLWICESLTGFVLKMSPNGTYSAFLGGLPLAFPSGITTGPDGNLWYTEYTMNNITQITTNDVVTQFSIPTFSSGARNIIVGPDRNLWYTEQNGNKIARITTAGVITEFTVPTAGAQPWGLTNGPDGNIWFTEYGASKIANITTAGTITEYSIPTTASSPYGITVGPDGNIWFTENGQNKIGKFIL